MVEFQGQCSERAGDNLLIKIGLYGEQFPTRDVIGIGGFLRARDVPVYPSGIAVSPGLVRIVILEQILPAWLAREPENPSLAVFAPLLIEDEAELRARARSCGNGSRARQSRPMRATCSRKSWNSGFSNAFAV